MSATAQLPPPQTTATARPSLPDLILLRLLPASQSVGTADLRKDLTVFFHDAPAPEDVTRALTSLRAEGYVTAKGQRATDAGRARALQCLGLEALPPKTDWGTLKRKFLVPRALGTSAEALKDGKKLAALLLKRELGLPVATGDTLSKVFEATACQVLGFPDHTELRSLVPLLLARKMGAESPPALKDVSEVVPRVLLGAPRRGVDGLRAVALRGWSDGDAAAPRSEPAAPQVEEPFDLEAFANTVKAVARTCPTGRFGEYKVFISHVWAQLRNDEPFRTMGLEEFKVKLVEANQARHLSLIPADMNQVFDEIDLLNSRTQQRNSTYHLLDLGKHA